MRQWSIGTVASQFDVSPSTLRYYESRGFLTPSRTATGARRYDRAQLRRIAFIRLGSGLGISLDVIAAILDQPQSHWQEALALEQARIERHIADARNAAALLTAAANCPHRHPGRDCPDLYEALDLLVDGTDPRDLADHFDRAVPPG